MNIPSHPSAVTRFGGQNTPTRAEKRAARKAMTAESLAGKHRREASLLSQLQALDGRMAEIRITVLQGRKDHSLRFKLLDPANGQRLMLVIGSPYSTGLLSKGRPLLDVAAFFYENPGKKGLSSLGERIYNGGQYTAKSADRFKPVPPGIRLALKLKGSLGTSPHHQPNPSLDRQLIALLIKAADQAGERPTLDTLIRTGKLPA